MCALSAPLSSNAVFSLRPSYCAGQEFADLAKQYIFDAGGRLRIRPSLEVAQARNPRSFSFLTSVVLTPEEFHLLGTSSARTP